MKRFSDLFIALASAVLLWAAWPVSPLTILIFVAWIPLLWLESTVTKRKRFFALTYITMFTWNILTTWWIWNASVPGAIAAFFANSFLMCIPWLGFSVAKKWLGETAGYISLIAFWMCFEFIHLQDWGLSWPWLTLGNVFAAHPAWIQWYQYTGTSGGTLWVLVVNILLFLHFKRNFRSAAGRSYKYMIPAVLALMLPILLSTTLGINKKKPADTPNVVVVQPNIDPYEKIFTGSIEAQVQKLINLSEQNIDENTGLVVWPETALFLANGIEESTMKQNMFLNNLWRFLQRHPQITLFTGIESYKAYDSKKTSTAREASPGFYYDSFNGSVLVDSSGPVSFYHKSMLVPGVETLPWFLKFIDSWFEKFGGTTAGYARQAERTVLTDTRHGFKIAPAICYESIYGEYMSKYVKNGANIICIITNDGWWGNTPGHKQHMNYARLRAIETNRWVARSANTGISCFIDPYGNIYDQQPWDKAASIRYNVPLNTSETFYVKHGDIVSRIMIVLSIVFILWTTYALFTRKWRKTKSTTV